MVQIESLTADHRRRLRWFEENEGQTLGEWPKPLEGNGYLLNKARGIYRPVKGKYALSLRIAFSDRYGDGPDFAADGTWKLLYHREVRTNQRNPQSYKTNRGVVNCLKDGVPIGVVQQVPTESNVAYRVFGLGIVTDHDDRFFVVEGPTNLGNDSSAKVVTDETVPADIERILRDERQRTIAEVYRRRGQGRFRQELLRVYDRRCAVTGCEIVDILEAAHILPHRGVASDIIENGLLLRADIHTLFDLSLLRINPKSYSVEVEKKLRDDQFYAALHGRKLRLPADRRDWPKEEYLQELDKIIKTRN